MNEDQYLAGFDLGEALGLSQEREAELALLLGPELVGTMRSVVSQLVLDEAAIMRVMELAAVNELLMRRSALAAKVAAATEALGSVVCTRAMERARKRVLDDLDDPVADNPGGDPA